MDPISVETLYTSSGIVAVIMIVVQVLKVLVPYEFSVSLLRQIALVLGAVLYIVVAIVSDVGEGATVVAWIVIVVNGLITGLAATALFETVKFGTSRSVTVVDE